MENVHTRIGFEDFCWIARFIYCIIFALQNSTKNTRSGRDILAYVTYATLFFFLVSVILASTYNVAVCHPFQMLNFNKNVRIACYKQKIDSLS